MTLADALTLAGGALGGGGLATVVTAWIRSRAGSHRIDRAAEARVIEQLREILREEREIVAAARAGEHAAHAGHLQCLDRVAKLEERLARLEGEHAGCPKRIAALEEQIKSLLAAKSARADLTPIRGAKE